MFTSDWMKSFHSGIFSKFKNTKKREMNFCKLEKAQKHGLNVLQAEKTEKHGLNFFAS